MYGGCEAASIPTMPSGSVGGVLDHAGYVYGAATAACADPSLAEAVAERVLTSATRSGCGEAVERGRLVEEALVLAVRVDPSPPFAGLPPMEREVIALARLGGCSAHEIALALETSIASVKAAMRTGLARLAGACEHATTP
jgi:DNA-binding NarL/FixJ family response regulator